MAKPSFDFRGKKALVTGGSRGIGRAIVGALSKANIDKIYVVGRSQTSLDAVKAEVPRVETISVDLADWTATEQALRDIEPVDFLVNNAGCVEFQQFFDITEESMDRILSLNLKGLVNVSQIVCKKMMELDSGAVVNMSSAASRRPLRIMPAYSASKAGIDMLTQQMALVLAPKIRVNSVNPTVVLTDPVKELLNDEGLEMMKSMLAMGRIAELDDVSTALLYLLSEGSGMTTGHFFPVCGGFTAL